MQPASATYSVKLTIQDAALILSSIEVSPAQATVNTNGRIQFTAVAKDQNGDPLTVQPSFVWSMSAGQSIDTDAGIYYAGPTPAGPFTVIASATVNGVSVQGTATLTVFEAIAVLNPQGGETFAVGDDLVIMWRVYPERTTSGVSVYLSVNEGESWSIIGKRDATIANGDAEYYAGNTGTMRWRIAPTFIGDNGAVSTVSNACLVKVSAPYEPEVTEAFSGNFTIASTQAVRRSVAAEAISNVISARTLPSGRLQVRYRPENSMHFSVVDGRGRRLATVQPPHGTSAIVLPAIAPGTYILRAHNGTRIDYRLIVSHEGTGR